MQENAVQEEEEPQAVHVALETDIALQLYDDSQPLVITESLLYFPLEQVRAVHAEEEVHAVQVALATEIAVQ